MSQAASEQPHALLSGLSVSSLYRAWRTPEVNLSAEESASTLFRFFRSKHVRDLKLIAVTTFALFLILLVVVVIVGIVDARTLFFAPSPAALLQQAGTSPHSPVAAPSHIRSTIELFEFLVKYIGPALPVTGLVIGWAYRSASARLGVIDLFACEISTLCRVGTILDVGERYVQKAEHPRPEAHDEIDKKLTDSDSNFVSKEDYFPILETNAKDLQLLEALVVRYIAEFYTYMKATRDSLRVLATLTPPEHDRAQATSSGNQSDAWGSAFEDVIYLLFLGYESGRKAVEDLIEYQPSRAENRMVILLTELKCYSFLRKRFQPQGQEQEQEVHHSRLLLREKKYKKEVPELYHSVFAFYGENDEAWEPARKTARELAKRYKEAFGDDLTPPPQVRRSAAESDPLLGMAPGLV